MEVEVVRVWLGNPTSNGKFSGTAFFINENTLVTAKHVIRRYTEGYDIYISSLSDYSTVKIEKDNITLCDRDIAILKVNIGFPPPIISFTKEIKLGDEVEIKGFDENVHSSINQRFNKVSGYEGGEHHLYRLQNYIASGYSGSPAFIDNKLCGIVQARGKDKNLTYIIPISECCADFVQDELKKDFKKKNHIFLNFDDNIEVVQKFSEGLKELGHEVYISRKDDLLSDSRELKYCKYFILFLSKETFTSEIIIAKIKEIKKLQKHSMFPTIIPIRLNLDKKYNVNYDLSKLIDEIKPFIWKKDLDTHAIINKLDELILLNNTLPKSKQKLKLINTDIPIPNAPLRVTSSYYIERKEDRECYEALEWKERLIRIKGAKQFGKTSLIARLIKKEKRAKNVVVSFDFKNISQAIFENIETLLEYVCLGMSKELKLYPEIESENLVPNDKATEYLEELLTHSKKRITLVIDNADELFKYPNVSNDFFSLIRAWYEEAAMDEDLILNKFKMIVSHSTEAKFATKDINSSPFNNVGVGVVLNLFSKKELSTLAQKHDLEFTDNELTSILDYIGGHPYLSRLIFYSILKNKKNLDEVLLKDNELFSDHLRKRLWKINKNEKYQNILKDILLGKKCKTKDDRDCYILESIGLIKREKFICKLYEDYFRKLLE